MSALRLTPKDARELVRDFITDDCEVGDEYASSPSGLYDDYAWWCAGKRRLLITKQQFGHTLSALGYRRSLGLGGVSVRLGLAPRCSE